MAGRLVTSGVGRYKKAREENHKYPCSNGLGLGRQCELTVNLIQIQMGHKEILTYISLLSAQLRGPGSKYTPVATSTGAPTPRFLWPSFLGSLVGWLILGLERKIHQRSLGHLKCQEIRNPSQNTNSNNPHCWGLSKGHRGQMREPPMGNAGTRRATKYTKQHRIVTQVIN